MSETKPPQKPVFKRTEPDPFDINISDKSGLRTLFLSLAGIAGIIFTIYFITRFLLYFSPNFISVEMENKIFKNTHSYVFKGGQFSKPLTDFAKNLDPSNEAVEVYVITMSEPNAFCFLGNKLFVTSELLQTVESENELAFILSHELGHAKLRHNLKSLSVNLVMSLLFTFIDFLQPASQFLSTGYSRTMESEADDFALNAVTKVYGHTYGAEEFFVRLLKQQTKLEKEYLKIVGGYLATHPDTSQRVAKILKTQTNNKNSEVLPFKKSKLYESLQIKTH